MRKAAPLLVLLAAMAMTACSALPKQGFATRGLGLALGPPLQSTFEPSADFVGNPITRPGDVVTIDPVDRNGRTNCVYVASVRRDDVFSQGFDPATGQAVYDATLRDCLYWQSRR